MNINEILSILPHRYPFVLVDRVRKINDDSIIAIKNVTINENFFVGHFPEKPVMPGVLIVEAMAQAGILMISQSYQREELQKKLAYFMSMEKVHFRKPVIPGDVLELRVQKIMHRDNITKMSGEAFVEEIRVADAIFSAIILDKNHNEEK